jgi:hypothetical protein
MIARIQRVPSRSVWHRPAWRGSVFLMSTAALLGFVAVSLETAASANNQITGPRTPVERFPGYPARAPVPEEMLDDTPQVIVLPSEPAEYGEDPAWRTGGVVGHIPAEARRLPEGYILAGREARIEQQDRWLVARLASAEGLPDAPPLRLLPNPRLGTLEAVLSQAGETDSFLLTGRVTEFHGRNYLLIEHLARVSPAAAPPPSEPRVESAVPGEPPPGDDAPAPAPAAEEVLRQLLETEPHRAVTLPEPLLEQDDGLPAGARDQDTPVLNQTGRIIAAESWWLFAFEDPGFEPRTQPVRILPNRLLETALALTGGGTLPVVLVVSGELTTHEGTNYLLLRKVLARRNYGNLR